MSTAPLSVEKANVEQAVPFFGVANMEQALRFYVDGLGFKMKNKWIDEGKLRWCWLELGGARLMLQEFRADKIPTGKLGSGMSICFMCKDALALYDEFLSRNVHPRRPFVGNRLWVTHVTDPDGYELFFESPTDAPEDSVYKG